METKNHAKSDPISTRAQMFLFERLYHIAWRSMCAATEEFFSSSQFQPDNIFACGEHQFFSLSSPIKISHKPTCQTSPLTQIYSNSGHHVFKNNRLGRRLNF
jgi:hypothetical protein